MNLDYPDLLDTISSELAPGRTESHAFLLWFLINYYRLEETDAADAVCDGPDDKGIDGVYVDENLETVEIFQAKVVQNSGRTLGDVQLKEFVGTLAQLHSFDSIEALAASTGNFELRNILQSENVATKIKEGYKVRGVFVTNICRDANAQNYINSRDDIFLHDKDVLATSFINAGPTTPVGQAVEFDVFGVDCAEYLIGDSKVIFAPIKASELVRLDGIASNELFSWNVRGSLGRTKVNKDIGKSIEDTDEHKNFLLYHNGLTLLCENLDRADEKIKISGYSVVNGCQSLTSLFDHRSMITDELRLMARLIQLPPESELADKITHHSNNQNPINARDLQSNSTIQRRLQNEFQQNFGNAIVYRIKRGEEDGPGITIDNDEAGRLLLAFDLQEPWTCHQNYKILDELHGAIYARPEVDAHRIYTAYILGECVVDNLDGIDNKLLAGYRLTRYFLLYLIAQALSGDEKGREFTQNPSPFLTSQDGSNRIRASIDPVIKDLIVDLNAEVQERTEQDNPLDFKRELKSPTSVRALSRSIISQYQKSVNRGRVSSFGNEWETWKAS